MVKFVVNGANRTGTHFLQSLLNNHPDITCLWDIFWSKDETPYGYPGYLKKVGRPGRFNIIAKNRTIYGFLDEYYAKATGVIAAGFLLKSETTSHKPAILRWFRRNNVKVTHLVRENYLMQEIAKEIRRQKLTSSHARTPAEVAKVKLNTDQLLNSLEGADQSLQKHRKRLNGLDVLEIKYESLVKNEQQELNRIFDFLGVKENLNIKSEFHKTEKESPRAMIENYDDVVAVLKNTRFSSFLD